MLEIALHDLFIPVDDIKKFLNLLIKLFFPVLLILVVSNSIDQVLSREIEHMLKNPAGTPSTVWLLGAISFFIGISLSSLAGLVVISGLKPNFNFNDLFISIKDNFNQILIEYTRSIGRILTWGLVFIFPAFIQYLFLIFVPFVVILNSDYNLGKIDALKYSTQVFKRKWLSASFALLIFALIIPLITSSTFDEYKIIWKTPIPSLLLSALDDVLMILSTYVLYKIYLKSEASLKTEAI